MIKTYDEFFEDKQLMTIHSYLHSPKWTSQKSTLDDDSSFDMYEVSHLDYFNTELLNHINSKLDSDFTLERIYFNGQDYGHDGAWHPDSDVGYTHLTYLNPDAIPDWGGETELEETSGIIKKITPQYNTSVIFKGSISHRGLSFNNENAPKRISLAFKLIPNTRVFGEDITPKVVDNSSFIDQFVVPSKEVKSVSSEEVQSGIADKIPMKQHTKPAVIIGSAMFEKDIVDEIIDETERLRDSGDNAGDKLVGQLKNNEKSKQVNFDMENEVGVLLKQIFNAIGDRYLQEMLQIGARADCYEIWTNHAFSGDYNPLHTHGSYTPAGLSGFMWLSNPQSIEDSWQKLITNEDVLEEFPDIAKDGMPDGTTPALHNAAGGIDGWTHIAWNLPTRKDIDILRPYGSCYLKPTVGQMFIFPNWLHHEVYPFFGDGERVSIAMNWNVQFADEEIMKGFNKQQKEDYYAKVKQEKWESEILETARREKVENE